MANPPPFPWKALLISIVVSIILSLLFSWILTKFGNKRPWLSLIFFIVVVFVLFWLIKWIIQNKAAKKLAVSTPSGVEMVERSPESNNLTNGVYAIF